MAIESSLVAIVTYEMEDNEVFHSGVVPQSL